MKLNSKTHGIIDYLIVIFLFAAPSIFDLPYITSVYTYGLAVLHLLVSCFTHYEYGLIRFIPMKIHGTVELVVAFLLVAVAFYLGSIDGGVAKELYFGLAISVFVLWLISDYTNKPESTREIPSIESNTDGGMI
jgi:hypothetical protein|nr:hypothetical protein [uncultured Pedobacter sp.]